MASDQQTPVASLRSVLRGGFQSTPETDVFSLKVRMPQMLITDMDVGQVMTLVVEELPKMSPKSAEMTDMAGQSQCALGDGTAGIRAAASKPRLPRCMPFDEQPGA